MNLTFTFKGTQHLNLSSPISAILVRKIRWDSLSALVLVHIWIIAPSEKLEDKVKLWQEATAKVNKGTKNS